MIAQPNNAVISCDFKTINKYYLWFVVNLYKFVTKISHLFLY